MIDPERTARKGNLHVDLWRGLFRAEVRVWQDVRPAAGGLLESISCRYRDADRVFEETAARYGAR